MTPDDYTGPELVPSCPACGSHDRFTLRPACGCVDGHHFDCEHYTGPGSDRPAPVVPDSPDLRERRVRHVLDSHGVDESMFEGEGAAVGLTNLVSDLLAALPPAVPDSPDLRERVEALVSPLFDSNDALDCTDQQRRNALCRLRAVLAAARAGGGEVGVSAEQAPEPECVCAALPWRVFWGWPRPNPHPDCPAHAVVRPDEMEAGRG